MKKMYEVTFYTKKDIESRKEYKYKGYTFYATKTIHANTMRPLYEIIDLKEYGHRPFLTSIKACKEYIDKYAK